MARKLEDMMQDLMVIQKNQMSSDELIRARMTKTETIVLGLAGEFGDLKTNVFNITDRVDNLEFNSEITDEQVNVIQGRVKARVSKVLDYPNGDSSKYYRIFIADIYSFLRNNHSLGSKTATTRKKHYDTVMKGIEAWHPDIQALKDRKDKLDKIKEGQNG